MIDPLMTPADVSRLTGISTKTLANWRSLGRGPAYRKLGRNMVRYEPAVIQAWIGDCRFEPQRRTS